MQIQDILATLQQEFETIRIDFVGLDPILLGGDNAEDRHAAADIAATLLERGAETVEMLELHGLAGGCRYAAACARLLPTLPDADRIKAVVWQDAWLQLVIAYLGDPAAHDIAASLARHLAGTDSGAAMAPEALALIHEALQVIPGIPDIFAEPRDTTAHTIDIADMSLDIPDDVDAAVVEVFLADAPGYAQRFARHISGLIAGQAPAEHLTEARRIVHSLKGSASIVGIRAVATLTHRLEDILDRLAAMPADSAVPPELAELLLDATDGLEQMVAALLGEEAPPDAIGTLLQRVCDCAFLLQQDGCAFENPDATATPADPAAVSAAMHDASLSSAPPAATAAGAEAMARVPLKVIDRMFRQTEGLVARLTRLQLSLQAAAQSHAALLRQQSNVEARIAAVEDLVDTHSSMMEKTWSGATDPLEFRRYSELHVLCQMLSEAVADYRQLVAETGDHLGGLDEQLVEHTRMGRELQYLVEGTRMLPLSTLSARLERNVRQTCRATGKTVSLEIRGDDIRVDRDVLNRLAEPLMHVLRNAVDHGIESAGERVEQGKPAAGRLVLQFQRLGQAVEVRCTDDGRGYDFERIRAKAVSLGLIGAGDLPDEEELTRLTMTPGFSTSAAVTEVSGRGIGMDIVLSRMQAMHGGVAVKSVRGTGTEVCLRFQGSLVTQHVLLVRVDTAIMAIPSHQVEFALPAGSGSAQSADGARRWRYLDRSLDHYFLADLVGLASVDAAEMERKPVLAVRHIHGTVALSVDELVDSHQSVVKDMGMYLSGMHGILGAIMRADGAIVPLLDIAALLDKPSDRVHRAIEAARGPARTAVLVVDDSPAVRQSLTLLLNDAGYAVTTARDGMEAIALAAKVKPDIVLTDLEMPVLGGLELTQHLRAQPETHALPIVMITSRSLEKHRKLAEHAGVSWYVTKPYMDQELLVIMAQLLASGAPSSAIETTGPTAAG